MDKKGIFFTLDVTFAILVSMLIIAVSTTLILSQDPGLGYLQMKLVGDDVAGVMMEKGYFDTLNKSLITRGKTILVPPNYDMAFEVVAYDPITLEVSDAVFVNAPDSKEIIENSFFTADYKKITYTIWLR